MLHAAQHSALQLFCIGDSHSLWLCRSKLSSVCWNSYVKSNLICSDYEGVVQLWDVSQQTETMTFEEHAKRVWSVDFSHVGSDPLSACMQLGSSGQLRHAPWSVCSSNSAGQATPSHSSQHAQTVWHLLAMSVMRQRRSIYTVVSVVCLEQLVSFMPLVCLEQLVSSLPGM